MPQQTIGQVSIVLGVPDELPAQRTYVTFGLERGGTSSVAGIQRALGLYLGPISAGNNNEDLSFMHYQTHRAMRKTIAERDQEHDVWGFKLPRVVIYLPAIQKNLRNPFFVVVYRDPVATALSRSRWDGNTVSRPVRMALHEASTYTSTNLSFVLAAECPCLLISNERAENDQSALIDEIAAFLGVEAPDDDLRQRILDYIAPGSYKDFATYIPERAAEQSGGAPGQ